MCIERLGFWKKGMVFQCIKILRNQGIVKLSHMMARAFHTVYTDLLVALTAELLRLHPQAINLSG